MDYFDWYAAYLHRACPVVDAHLDLVTEVYRRRLAGEKGILKKYYKDEFQKSGVNLVLASLFLGEDELRDSREGCAFPKGAVLKKSMEERKSTRLSSHLPNSYAVFCFKKKKP